MKNQAKSDALDLWKKVLKANLSGNLSEVRSLNKQLIRLEMANRRLRERLS